jgi:pilus assembly protein CpaD
MIRSLMMAGLLGASALALAGCASDPKSPAVTARSPTDLYPLQARETPDQIALALHPDGLSPAQVQALAGLAQRRGERPDAVIVLKTPKGAVDAATADAVASLARRVLLAQGVPAALIRQESYAAPGDASAPLLAGYARLEASVPKCGLDWDNLTSTEDNRVQSNFGCATTANMAAMIADPADLAHPRAEDAPDAERREEILDRYRKGATTASDDNEKYSGAVSKAVP